MGGRLFAKERLIRLDSRRWSSPLPDGNSYAGHAE
jgi:hypothetical protein